MQDNWANMQDLGESLRTKLKEEIVDPNTGELSYRSLYTKEEQQRQAERKRESDIKRLGGVLAYEDYTKEKFNNKSILDALRNFPEENYFLFGPAGTGKTHASVAVLREVPNGQVMTMPRISRILRRCETPDEEIAAIQQLSDLVMLLDDLGSEKMTDFLRSVFFEIIDRRVQYKKKGIIFTSNLSLDQLAPIIGDRIVSRIMWLVKGNILEFSGKDYRWQK